MKELENKRICSDCKGKCCKLGGCEWFVSDFKSLSVKAIDAILKEGRTSIIATPYTRFQNGKFKCTPILSLRARNINRGEVNLLSFETCCASLTDEGCYFEFKDRPSGGKHLIPQEDHNCRPDFSSAQKLNDWLPYQKALRKLVTKYTGKSVDEKFREDVIDFIFAFATEDLSQIPVPRLVDMSETVQELMLAYPEEAAEAAKRSMRSPKLIMGKPTKSK